MTGLVTLRHVHKVYGRGSERIDVLHGVNLDIPAGDFLALMGPSRDPQAAAAARRVLRLDKGRLIGEAAA